jgi:hypothetical protein
MLPRFVKEARWPMFKDIVLTYSSIIVKDALAAGLAYRHQKETNRALASLSEFRHWSATDDDFSRRLALKRKLKLERVQKATRSSVYRGIAPGRSGLLFRVKV